MEYLGDFPPCSHRFINSNGIILCQFCGVISNANKPLGVRLVEAQERLR